MQRAGAGAAEERPVRHDHRPLIGLVIELAQERAEFGVPGIGIMDGDVTRVCRVRAGRAEAFDLPPRDGCDVRDKCAFPSKTDFPPLGGEPDGELERTRAVADHRRVFVARKHVAHQVRKLNGQELPPSGQAVHFAERRDEHQHGRRTIKRRRNNVLTDMIALVFPRDGQAAETAEQNIPQIDG